jgi:anthranilate synthase/aminodeoxychorismate synthase-like glutamine amidotransferase
MNVLVIDCHDSFTYNLVQLVGALGANPVVVKSDADPIILKKIKPDRVILSPGPGHPKGSGLCLHALRTLSRTIPTLGVCLGHQAICHSAGASVIQGYHLMHGKTSQVNHDGKGIYRGIENPFIATRYHSLIVDPESLPASLEVTARSLDDGYVMGVRHREYPIEGVQFHPESILSINGPDINRNFLNGNEVES